MSGFKNDFPALGEEQPVKNAQNTQVVQKEEVDKQVLDLAKQSSLKTTAREFVPKSKIVKTDEQFPDLGAVGDSNNKKK